MLQSRPEASPAPGRASAPNTPRLVGDCTRLLLKKWLRPAQLPG